MTRLVLRFLVATVLMAVLTVVLVRLEHHYTHGHRDEELVRTMRGPATLVEAHVRQTPPSRRPDVVADLTEQFGYPIALGAHRGRTSIYADTHDHDVVMHVPLEDGSSELVMGPLPDDIYERTTVTLVAVLGTILGALVISLMATIPLVRRIQALERVAVRLGRGDLHARSEDGGGDALERLAGSLNVLAERVVQLLSDQKELMRTVAHEIRTPVARLRFRLEGLRSAHARGDGSGSARHIEGIDSDIVEIDGLVEELMTYVSFDEFETEGHRLPMQGFSAHEALARLIAETDTGDKHVDVALECGTDLAIAANRRMFDRATSNVLRNAIRHARGRVRITCEADDVGCVIVVDDDGPGIPEADRERVLKAFVRLDETKSTGVGLGLAIVTRILALHGGTFRITSNPWGGARGEFEWPEDGAPSSAGDRHSN